jgi:hypothetical protein
MAQKEIINMLRSFLTIMVLVIIAFIIEHGSVFNLDWKKAIDASIVAGLGVLYNFFRASDPRYGAGYKEVPDEKS